MLISWRKQFFKNGRFNFTNYWTFTPLTSVSRDQEKRWVFSLCLETLTPRPPFPLLTGVALIISGNMGGGEADLEASWARHFSSFLSADQSNLVVFVQFVKERESTRLSVSSVQPWVDQVGRPSITPQINQITRTALWGQWLS